MKDYRRYFFISLKSTGHLLCPFKIISKALKKNVDFCNTGKKHSGFRGWETEGEEATGVNLLVSQLFCVGVNLGRGRRCFASLTRSLRCEVNFLRYISREEAPPPSAPRPALSIPAAP